MSEAGADQDVWTITRARSQFSDVARRAEQSPQMITRRGKHVAVVVSAKEWQKKTERRGTLAEFLMSSPLRDIDLDLERLREGYLGTRIDANDDRS